MTNHKRGCQNKYVKHTSKRAVTDVCCFYLLKIIMTIIKANTQIVSVTKPNKSKYIISNNALSIICTTSNLVIKVTELKVATTSAIFISYVR